MYFTNVNSQEQHMAFIGRWNIFTKGHEWLMTQKIKENPGKPILVFVRDTSFDEIPTKDRAELVKLWMVSNNIKGSIMIIPDILGIYYGRTVGYQVCEMLPPTHIKNISATEVRKKINDRDETWKDLVAPGTADYIEKIYSEK